MAAVSVVEIWPGTCFVVARTAILIIRVWTRHTSPSQLLPKRTLLRALIDPTIANQLS